ncbi:hypothetical protein ACOBR2_07250 [Telmatobacter bradus]|uniref:hypothetical protein n=1 Tax=Telmatobacter bradus TaxID=474953 RepID=UPI003B43C32D
MKRLPGVIVSAIVLILVSLLPMLLALGIAFAGFGVHHMPVGRSTTLPPWIDGVFLAEGAVLLLIGLWGWITVYGLLMMRRWARISMLVIGGGQAFFSLISALITLLLCFVPLPSTSAHGADPASVQRIVHGVFIGMALFELVLAGIGVWWLVYFLRRSVVESFAAGTADLQPSRRPLPIAVLAVLKAISVLGCLALAFLPFPAFAAGVLLSGWSKTLLLLAYVIAYALAAYGLWTLREWGRRLAMALLGFGVVNTAIWLIHPGNMLDYNRQINRSMGLGDLPVQPGFGPWQTGFSAVVFTLSLLVLGGMFWVLHSYRAAFQPVVELAAEPVSEPVAELVVPEVAELPAGEASAPVVSDEENPPDSSGGAKE